MPATPMDDVLIFLLAAVVVVSLFKYMKISSVIGYLIAGTLIGPGSMGLIQNLHVTEKLADIGVVFLLFSIGLKMSFARLRSLSYYVFGLGLLQFFVTGLVILGICLLFDLPSKVSVLLGAGLALSSTAVSLQVLAESSESSSRYGRISFAILLAQDLVVIILLVLLPTIDAPNNASLLNILTAAAIRAFWVLLGIVIFGRFILKPIYRIIASLKNQELFSSTSLLIVLGMAMTTEHAGLSMELGAFLAGLLIAETEYRHQVEADISPFHGLLLGLFFMSVGMKINPTTVVNEFVFISCVIVAMITIKAIILFALTLLFRIPVGCALKTSLLLSTGGEFIFILLAPKIQSGLIPEALGNIIIISVAISMILTPALANLAKIIEGRSIITESEVTLKSALSEVGDLRSHTIIIGFDRIGQIVAQIMQKQMLSYVAIDNDMHYVNDGRNKGYQIFYGDARRTMVLRTLGITKAKSAVICMNDDQSALRAALVIKHNFPDVEVFVHLHGNDVVEKVKKVGAHVIMPQIIEPGLQLAQLMLRNHGSTIEQTSSIINDFRKSINDTDNSNDQSSDEGNDDHDEDEESTVISRSST